MKSISTVWLSIGLCSALSLSAATLSAASPANGVGGDAAIVNRSREEAKRTASSVSPADVQILERARAANQDVYASLQSFVCKEEINRFKGRLNGQTASRLGTVTAKLSFERGVEQYTNVTEDHRPKAGMSSLTGAWSEGEFGTLLLQTQQLLATQQVDFDSYASLMGEPVARYHFDVAGEDSPWDLAVAGHHYRLPFRTSVWISAETGEILKIQRHTISVPAAIHISEIQWGITLDHFAMNGKTWLLPATGNYAVLYNQSTRVWNQISFTGYQRYGAEASLKFE